MSDGNGLNLKSFLAVELPRDVEVSDQGLIEEICNNPRAVGHLYNAYHEGSRK